jgi:hypothetical protein
MIPSLATLSLALALAPAMADGGPHSYALLVGSNQAGPGQKPLQYAVQDALRVRQVLVELGDFNEEDIHLVEDPSADELLRGLDALAGRLAVHAAQDEDAVVVFYYSGHAKAQGLELGADELPLEALEARLEALPADFTLAVLDACQAGAISGVKGAAPAADFSHNATEGLSTRGLAVMASSTGAELSQESAELEGSFFTHHLVSGLRGAADQDHDGRITLAEAYAYAYDRTLISTAATAVGRQHVTLETHVAGKGELVLTRPGQASAWLRLPGEMAGDLLLYRSQDRSVSAELHKAAGSPLRVGLIPGEYEAILREGGDLYRCALEVQQGANTFYRGHCEYVPPPLEVDIKGSVVTERHERWMLELGLAGGRARESDFVDRLEEFGFDWPTQNPLFWPSASLSWTARPLLGAVVTVGKLDHDGWEREFGDHSSPRHVFEWQTWRASLQARGSLPMLSGWLTPYLQAGGGPALGLTSYRDDTDGYDEREQHWGWHLIGAAGLQFMPTTPRFRHVGLYHQIEYSTAPVIENLLGDVHDSGGLLISMGVRAGF